MFERIATRDVSKRIDMAGIYAHPWTKGEIYTQHELLEVMGPRIEVYNKICMREIEQKLAKYKWMSKLSIPRIMAPQIELSLNEKIMHTDAQYSTYVAECNEINARLSASLHEKKVPPPQSIEQVNSGSFSDDQANSGSDNSFKENEEDKIEKPQRELSLEKLADLDRTRDLYK